MLRHSLNERGFCEDPNHLQRGGNNDDSILVTLPSYHQQRLCDEQQAGDSKPLLQTIPISVGLTLEEHLSLVAPLHVHGLVVGLVALELRRGRALVAHEALVTLEHQNGPGDERKRMFDN